MGKSREQERGLEKGGGHGLGEWPPGGNTAPCYGWEGLRFPLPLAGLTAPLGTGGLGADLVSPFLPFTWLYPFHCDQHWTGPEQAGR